MFPRWVIDAFKNQVEAAGEHHEALWGERSEEIDDLAKDFDRLHDTD